MILAGITALLLLGAIASPVTAEEPAGVPLQFQNVRLSSDPAFLLLGVSSEKVTRPTELSDVAVSLRTASDNFEALPRSYAVAFAPYWMMSQPRQRFADWADASGPGAALVQSLSMSLAADTRERGGLSRTRTAIGLRTPLRRSAVNAAYRQAVEESVQRLRPEATAILQRLRANATGTTAQRIIAVYTAAAGDIDAVVFDANDPLLPPQATVDTTLAAAWMEFLRALEGPRAQADALFERVYDLANEIDLAAVLEDDELAALQAELQETDAIQRRDLLPDRFGFQVDLAGAMAWEFTESVASSGQLHSGGGWLHAAYVMPTSSAILVLRGTGTRGERPVLDLGGRLTLDTSQRVSPSLESVIRWRSKQATDYSMSLIFETNLGRSNSLVFAFGRDFGPDLEGSLITSLQFVTGVGFDVWFDEG